MALSTGSPAAWSDIQTLYNSLRDVQNRHGITQSNIPNNPGAIAPESVTALRNLVSALYSERHLSGSISSSNPTEPTRGTLIKAAPFSTLETELNRLRGICHNDSSNFGFGFSSNDGFGFSTRDGFGFSSDRGFGFSSNAGFGFGSNQGFGFGGNQGFSFGGNQGFSFSGNQGFGFSGREAFGFGGNETFSFSSVLFSGGGNSGGFCSGGRSSFCARNFTFR